MGIGWGESRRNKSRYSWQYSQDDYDIGVFKAKGQKCARCWKYRELNNDGILVAVGQHTVLRILKLQPEGGRTLTARDISNATSYRNLWQTGMVLGA